MSSKKKSKLIKHLLISPIINSLNAGMYLVHQKQQSILTMRILIFLLLKFVVCFDILKTDFRFRIKVDNIFFIKKANFLLFRIRRLKTELFIWWTIYLIIRLCKQKLSKFGRVLFLLGWQKILANKFFIKCWKYI